MSEPGGPGGHLLTMKYSETANGQQHTDRSYGRAATQALNYQDKCTCVNAEVTARLAAAAYLSVQELDWWSHHGTQLLLSHRYKLVAASQCLARSLARSLSPFAFSVFLFINPLLFSVAVCYTNMHTGLRHLASLSLPL